MPFVWTENIAVDAWIDSADLQEIRDNVNHVEDNKCAADDTVVNASYDSVVDNGDEVGYDGTDRGTVHSGDDSGYDGTYRGTVHSGEDTGYDSTDDGTVNDMDNSGYHGVYDSGVNSDHRDLV